MNTEKTNLKFGYYATLSLVLLTIIAWGFAMIAIPPVGPYCPGNCMTYPFSELLSYYPRDYYWMYLAIFQLFAYLIFMVSIHFITNVEKKLYSFLSLSFALITSIVLLIAYFVQFSVVPISMMKGETDGIALLTQYNEHGIFIAMEELGYISMSISYLFLALSFFVNKPLEKSIRLILIISFILTILAFVFYTFQFGIDRSYRFEVAAISINWLATITAGILISVFIKRKLKVIK
ncbi:MAG: hypothetical protein K9H49_15580 [Bacteroidales bacterium]|nr:hypothetical protein [Bacteroidales bacterium]MCF8405489.1 hypothetical protein [Bacteroidales bacterium]